jgi:hypothetical protein
MDRPRGTYHHDWFHDGVEVQSTETECEVRHGAYHSRVQSIYPLTSIRRGLIAVIVGIPSKVLLLAGVVDHVFSRHHP